MSSTVAEQDSASYALHHLGDRLAASRPAVSDGTLIETQRFAQQTDDVLNSELMTDFEEIVVFDAGNLAGNVGVLLYVLDAVSQIHPFISVAVAAFKGVVELELTRRANDGRVREVYAKMCNAMANLRTLGRIPCLLTADPAYASVGKRLEDHLKTILEDIKFCAEACNRFQSQPLIKRVWKAIQWREMFISYMKRFDDHGETLRTTLDMLNTARIGDTNDIVGKTHQRVLEANEKLGAILDRLMPLEEAKIFFIIRDRFGGLEQAFAQESSESSLRSLLRNHSIAYPGDLPITSDNIAGAWEGDEEGSEEDRFRRLNRKIALREGMSAKKVEPDQIDQGLITFFDAQTPCSARELAGKLMEYCMKTYISNASAPRVDSWAEQYLTQQNITPLEEVLDDHESTTATSAVFVIFCSSRPRGWSLPRWLAYWTVGRALATRWYYDQIERVLEAVRASVDGVLPENWIYVQKLLGEGIFYACDHLLSGLPASIIEPGWSEDLYKQFEELENDHYGLLRQRLEALDYDLDSPLAVDLILFDRMFDKSVLPLLWLLLERCQDFLTTTAARKSLRRQDGLSLRRSLWSLLRSCHLRTKMLEDSASLCDRRERYSESYFSKFSFGLYRYIFAPASLFRSNYIAYGYKGQLTSPVSRRFDKPALNFTNSNKDTTPPSRKVSPHWHPLWNYDNLIALIVDSDSDYGPRHALQRFIQMCVDQNILLPDDSHLDIETFRTMAKDALSKSSAGQTGTNRIFEPGAAGGYRQSTLQPFQRIGTMELSGDLTSFDVPGLSDAWKTLSCVIVDCIVRRRHLHTPVTCRYCQRRSLNGARMICLPCYVNYHGENETCDYCTKCFHGDMALSCISASDHLTWQPQGGGAGSPRDAPDDAATRASLQHLFMQVRRFTANRWGSQNLFEAHRIASDYIALQAHRSYPSPTCHYCRQFLSPIDGHSSPRYWICVECKDDPHARTAICVRCNLKHEKLVNFLILEDLLDEPLDFEHLSYRRPRFDRPGAEATISRNSSQDSSSSAGSLIGAHHKWFHDLVLVAIQGPFVVHPNSPQRYASNMGPTVSLYSILDGPSVYESPTPMLDSLVTTKDLPVPERRRVATPRRHTRLPLTSSLLMSEITEETETIRSSKSSSSSPNSVTHIHLATTNGGSRLDTAQFPVGPYSAAAIRQENGEASYDEGAAPVSSHTPVNAPSMAVASRHVDALIEPNGEDPSSPISTCVASPSPDPELQVPLMIPPPDDSRIGVRIEVQPPTPRSDKEASTTSPQDQLSPLDVVINQHNIGARVTSAGSGKDTSLRSSSYETMSRELEPSRQDAQSPGSIAFELEPRRTSHGARSTSAPYGRRPPDASLHHDSRDCAPAPSMHDRSSAYKKVRFDADMRSQPTHKPVPGTTPSHQAPQEFYNRPPSYPMPHSDSANVHIPPIMTPSTAWPPRPPGIPSATLPLPTSPYAAASLHNDAWTTQRVDHPMPESPRRATHWISSGAARTEVTRDILLLRERVLTSEQNMLRRLEDLEEENMRQIDALRTHFRRQLAFVQDRNGISQELEAVRREIDANSRIRSWSSPALSLPPPQPYPHPGEATLEELYARVRALERRY